jgi:hypothetical protein
MVARQTEDGDLDLESVGYFDSKSKDEILRVVANEKTGMSAVEVIAICREASNQSKACVRIYQHKRQWQHNHGVFTLKMRGSSWYEACKADTRDKRRAGQNGMK